MTHAQETAITRACAHENQVHDLAEALAGCIEHCEWSTPQGQQAFQKALDVLAAARNQ